MLGLDTIIEKEERMNLIKSFIKKRPIVSFIIIFFIFFIFINKLSKNFLQQTKLEKRKIPEYIEQVYGKKNVEDYQKVFLEQTTAFEYKQFVEFIEKERSDKFTSVSSMGNRCNYNGLSKCKTPDGGKNEIWLFGGSTTFGYGVKNDETISAYLEKLFNKKYRIINFGSGFYYSTQERILFHNLLTKLPAPFAIVFIDGLNEFGKDYEFVVMELSSFQIYYLNNLNLYKAIVLNIYEDHLDWHPNFEEYRKAKLKIWEFESTENIKEEDYTYRVDPSTILPEQTMKESLFRTSGILEIVSKLPFHEDTLYSFIEVLKDLDLNMDSIDKYLSNYETEEHRFEFVDKFNEITFINDSKSTNFHSVSMATTKLDNGVLVLHGLTKNISSKDLKISDKINTILVPKDMEIDLSGTNAKLIKLNSIFDIEKELIKIIKPGDTVLFSCGGASFNDFKNYEERGNFFKSVVLNIKAKNA